MLTRIENAYLAILRVVVLVVATGALIVAAIGLAMSLPALARQVGLLPSPAAHGGTLGDYVAEKKASVPRQGTDSAGNDAAPAGPLRSSNADVQAAAKAIRSYLKGGGGMTAAQWEMEIEAGAVRVPAEATALYYADVRSLADQLGRSRGRRLTVEQIVELLDWNRSRFATDRENKDGEKAAATIRALFALYVASAAFVLFIMVVFTFLFVKVERSLRLVRTVRAETVHA